MTKRRENVDLTEGIIWKQMLLFFVPIWFGTLFQALYSTADAIIVGQLVGADALASVGNTASIVNVFNGLFLGLSMGGSVLSAQYFGGKQFDRLKRCVDSAIVLALGVGAVLMCAAQLLFPWLLSAIGTPEDIYGSSLTYLKIYAFGMVASAVYNMGAALLRGMGDSRRPVYILVASSLCNIGLDLLFVAAFRMGVAGVAAATVISQCFSAVLAIGVLLKGEEGYSLEIRELLHPDRKMIFGLLRLGVPAMVQSSSYSVTNVLIQSGVNSFGTVAVAAWTAYGSVDIFYWMTLNSMSAAVTTFAGQNYGAGQLERMKRGLRLAVLISVVFTVVMSTVIVVMSRQLLGIFVSDEAVIEVGRTMIRILSPCYILFIGEELYAGAIRAAGEALGPMIINLLTICVFRILWVWMALPKVHTIPMLCFCYPISWAMGSVAFLTYFRSGRWGKKAM